MAPTKIRLSADEVGTVIFQLPPDAQDPSTSGLLYDGEFLWVPERFAEAAEAADKSGGAARLKAALAAQIDVMAETERLKYITGGAGQAMEYQQSAAEAKACLAAIAADPEYEPGAADYPMLAASVGIDGQTIAEVAMTVNAMHEAWLSVGSAIRAARLAAKAAIDAAETVEAAQAAFDAVVWPVP